MKKLFYLVLFALVLTSCQTPTMDVSEETAPVVETSEPETTSLMGIQTTDGVRYVKNSDWDACTLSYLTAKAGIVKSARGAEATITPEELNDLVETLNGKETDNQYFVLDADKPVEEAPTCDIYITKSAAGSYEVIQQWLGYDRALLKENREGYEFDAQQKGYGALLFIDKIPPVPEPVIDTRTPYEKYTVNLISNVDGHLEACEHVTETCPEDEDLDKYFECILSAWQTWALSFGGGLYRIEWGHIYTPPVPAE